ncbi:ribokinase [Virgibacillus sp. C22-A2]|uniref:Ribokinase n=1 Tax=Virgibacillus tibetensis TaxID=3042313 RepID=A0ABU6KCR9_9BACI|nr:ribokinase [Virgibacillus sp. C22-A2]
MKITVIGSINIDVLYHVPDIVKPGETIHSSTYDTLFGGKGANQAVTIAQLGAEVEFVGCVGQDDFGNQALKNLQDNSVSTHHVQRSGDTGNALIQVSETGENAIILVKGANFHVTPESVQDAEKLIMSSDTLLLQLEIPLVSVITALNLAEKNGIPVILNPAPAQALSESILSSVDILTPNETELSTLTGMRINTDKDIEIACQSLLNKGVKVVVVTLGKKGAYFSDGKQSGWVPARMVKVIDTTGAGDAFNGALAFAYCKKYSLQKSIEFAIMIAGYVVTQRGAQIQLPEELVPVM